LQPGEGVELPKSSVQPLSDRFPYVAPSTQQKYKDGNAKEPIVPIYME
jgi:hypothetical protein